MLSKFACYWPNHANLIYSFCNSNIAPLLCSTRLTLFIMFCLATSNFVVQRFNINFGIVCMHRPQFPELQSSLSSPVSPQFLQENSSIHEQHLPASLESNSLVHEGHRIEPNGNTDEVQKVPTTTSSGSSWSCGEGRRVHNTTGEDSPFLAQFAWSKETKGGIIASFYYGLTFSQIPGGWFVDRFGAKSAILLSQLFLSILSMINPIAAQLGAEYMFVARLLQGVANVCNFLKLKISIIFPLCNFFKVI